MILVFDVGGTAIKYGVSDNQGNFAFTDLVLTPKHSRETFFHVVGHIYEETKKRYMLEGVAFSFPGEVHSEAGVIKGISAVEYLHHIPLKYLLQERFDQMPVSMANDANCAAMGELWNGIAAEHQAVVFVICGTGIGGAVIEQGRLYQGTTKNRGEFGNFPMGGYQDGKLMTWSDYTLEKQARKYHEKAGTKAFLDGKDLEKRSREGDLLAAELMEEFYYWMAVGCIILQFSFDPELIAIGGGISNNPNIINQIQSKVTQMLEGQRSGYLCPRIESCSNGNKANLYGALYYHLHADIIEGQG